MSLSQCQSLRMDLTCGDMQSNGTVQVKVSSGGGRDEYGNPVKVTHTWSDPVKCLIRKLRHSYEYVSDGKFEQSSYEILIENRDFEAVFVRLSDSKGKVLGEFEVQDISAIERSGRVKITV